MKNILFVCAFMSSALAGDMLRVEGGTYQPILGKKKEVKVGSFLAQETAVTNEQYLAFVKAYPRWQKSNVVSLFADTNYLKHWKDNTSLTDQTLLKSPVVNVSWFAARAYCEAHKSRLPTVDEWEYLAQFGPWDKTQDVSNIILEWYSKVNPEILPHVRSTFKNKFGLWDVHGLIWEWNEDFNTTFVTGESRGDSAIEKSMFCGSGSAGSPNPSNYAAFMRFGFRSSLSGNYTVSNLGFRCAKEN